MYLSGVSTNSEFDFSYAEMDGFVRRLTNQLSVQITLIHRTVYTVYIGVNDYLITQMALANSICTLIHEFVDYVRFNKQMHLYNG